MKPDSQHPSAGEHLLRRLSAPFVEDAPPPPPRVPESVLWAHAFGHLDPTEEPAVLEALARSPESRARLEELRQNIAIAAARFGERSLPPDAVPVRLLAALQAHGQALVAAFLRTGQALEAFIREPAWALVRTAGATLGPAPGNTRGNHPATLRAGPDEGRPPDLPLPPSPVQTIQGPGSIIVRVIRESHRSATVTIVFPPPPPTAAVELRCLRLLENSLQASTTRLGMVDDQRECRFDDCPNGVLEIRAPHRAPILIYLGDSPTPETV